MVVGKGAAHFNLIPEIFKWLVWAPLFFHVGFIVVQVCGSDSAVGCVKMSEQLEDSNVGVTK